MYRDKGPRVAVNFPYFIPYTGFFRMMEYADIFVALDCAQFPRRGYVHRNQLPDSRQQPRWLTLALEKQQRNTTLIKDIRFIEDIKDYMGSQLRRFPSLQTPAAADNPLTKMLLNIHQPPVELIIELLHEINCQLGIECRIIRSSELSLADNLSGADKVMTILRSLNASEYINAPGGKHLYDADIFADAGIELRILEHYQGNHYSILQRLITEPAEHIKQDIREQLIWQK